MLFFFLLNPYTFIFFPFLPLCINKPQRQTTMEVSIYQRKEKHNSFNLNSAQINKHLCFIPDAGVWGSQYIKKKKLLFVSAKNIFNAMNDGLQNSF